MHLQKTSRWRVALVICGVSAVALSALPMLPHLRPQTLTLPAVGETRMSSSEIVVDLRDDATGAQINDLNARLGIDLRPNSIEARDDKLMVATLASGADQAQVLSALKNDSMVEAAEAQTRFSTPERSFLNRSTGTPDFSESGLIALREAVDENASGPRMSTHAAANEDASGASKEKKPRVSKRGFKPNDPLFGEQWNFQMVGAQKAWTRSRGEGVVVAVIDTGIAARKTARGGQARDFNKTHFVEGYDFVNNDNDPYDDHGHGTHVGGTIAESTNNREGVAGLAFDATLMPIKVLDEYGSGLSSDVADGIRFAADNGANIINMSLGSAYPSDVIQAAVKYARRKGVLIVCAAGNGFGSPVGYPAAFPGCIAVSSVGPTGELAPYSSYGAPVALAAPGGDRSLDPNGGGIVQNTIFPVEQGGQGDGYYAFQGTSMASPHVAAVAALVMAQGQRDPSRVRDVLLRSASRGGPRVQLGAGILSASRATALVAREGWAAWAKQLLWGALVLPFFLKGRRKWNWHPRWWLRVALAGAFWLGAFGPDWASHFVGANSAFNLIWFSALLPFVLFFELEDKKGSQVVCALSMGLALCLSASLWGGVLSPFTATVFGWTTIPWTLANLVACLMVAGVSWTRATN